MFTAHRRIFKGIILLLLTLDKMSLRLRFGKKVAKSGEWYWVDIKGKNSKDLSDKVEMRAHSCAKELSCEVARVLNIIERDLYTPLRLDYHPVLSKEDVRNISKVMVPVQRGERDMLYLKEHY